MCCADAHHMKNNTTRASLLRAATAAAILMTLSGCVVEEAYDALEDACPFVATQGTWTVTYNDTLECQVGIDKLVVGGTQQEPELLYGVGDATGSFDSSTCTLTVKSYADWEDGNEPWADYRDLVLKFDGDSATGKLDYSAWWFCGGSTPTPLKYSAVAKRSVD